VNEKRTFHRIADELEPGWLDLWAAQGIVQIEAYLAKHAAFHAFLDDEV
jgi:hypothetical protein